MSSIIPLLKKTKAASSQIAALNETEKNYLIQEISQNIEKKIPDICAANKLDSDKLDDSNPKKDRLFLDEQRILDITKDIRKISSLPDPTGEILYEKKLENGIDLKKISVSLGVVGIIYESRPNVTLDTIALCIKSGNAVVLRGGSDAENSNKKIVEIVHEVLEKNNLDKNIVQLLPVDREKVSEFLQAEKYIDILIPRGSQNLINFVRENSKIPTIETGAGVCHTFVEKTASIKKSAQIVINAKTQRPSVCNALDTILLQPEIAKEFLENIVSDFEKFKVEIFADDFSFEILKKLNYPFLFSAKPEDFGREFLDYKCSIKIVKTFEEALEHIEKFSSKHSEAICSEDQNLIEKFLQKADAAAVYANASTRFTDGGIFGLGAEIGISTQKLHARGPFALEKLVTEKWVMKGNGQIR